MNNVNPNRAYRPTSCCSLIYPTTYLRELKHEGEKKSRESVRPFILLLGIRLEVAFQIKFTSILYNVKVTFGFTADGSNIIKLLNWTV